MDWSQPHLPRQTSVDGYGRGGFRFGGMSHRGSIVSLPTGIWAWPVSAPAELDEAALAPLVPAATELDLFLLGTGADPWFLPLSLRALFRDAGVKLDVMPTGAALRTYNVLVDEGRRVGAALIAVG